MASSSGAVAFGANVDEDIARTWKQVEDRVIQMAGGDRSKLKQGLGIEKVLQYLDDAQAKEAKSSEKYGTVKNIFNRTLQCIQTVGGIVADGASYVFQPANTCYNALTFVIQAWQGYEGIFESLASLLEKCIEFLDRLSYYAQSGMDAKLAKVACQHLQFFVEICDRTLHMKSKRNKFKAFMKQMFLNDDGVQELLSRMDSLVDKERGLVAAQAWKASNEAASYSKDGLSLTRKMHNSLVEDKNQLKREKEVQKWKVWIVDALECDRSVLDPDTPEPWEKAWKRHKADILEGTGEWLSHHSLFKSWVSGTSGKPILGLEGGDGTGKTLLASNVILHLRKMKSIEPQGSRVVVAHNFLDYDSKSSSTQNDLNNMSRSLMCQLALGDEPFMKSVASICEKSKFFNSPFDMWTQLLLENEDRVNIDATFFIILDGLGTNVGMFLQLFQRLSASPLLQRTRILVTGQHEMFKTLERDGAVAVDRIVLGGEPNKKDLELYITDRMNNMEILKDTARPGVADMRDKILKDLQSSTKGDYYKINRVLDNISKSDEVEEINEFLQNAGSARNDQIESDIEKLNQTRSPKEIAEINEIILWVITGHDWMTPLQIEAALALKSGTGSTGHRTSLMSLESKIKTKYPLFKIVYGDVLFTAPEMAEKIPLKKRDSPDDESSSGFKEIQPAEINIVRHYLSAVCPKDLYQKFGFDEFFDLKMVRKGNYICQNPDNAHITVALRCLTCLVEERTEKTLPLHRYSLNFLLYHLEETDLSLADRELKSEVGVMLVRLFTEPYAINSLFRLHQAFVDDEEEDELPFGKDTVPRSWDEWLFVDRGVTAIEKWFKDSAVIEKVKENDLVTAFNSSISKQQVLFDFACKKSAKDLFREELSKRETLKAFTLLLAILREEDGPFKETGFDPTLDMVQLVEDWAENNMGTVVEKDALWESQAAALLTYLSSSGENIPKEEAEKRAKRALELNPDNYGAFFVLAQALESREEAIKILEDAIKQLIGNAEWQQDPQHQSLLVQMIIELGDNYWDAEDEESRDKAVQAYSKVLQVSKNYAIIKDFSAVLGKYAAVEKWQLIISFFEDLAGGTEEGSALAGNFLLQRLWEEADVFYNIVVKAASKLERFDFIDGLFKSAVATNPEPYRMWALKTHYGAALLEFKGHENDGITLWEEAVDIIPDEKKWYAIELLSRNVPRIYMDLAAKIGEKTPEAQVYYDKIEALWRDFEAQDLSATEARVSFAQYFRFRGEDAKAKEIVKPSVVAALEMLADDDLENDYLSYWELNQVFAAFHDISNNMVAWEMLTQSKDANKAEYERKLAIYNQRMNNADEDEEGEEEGEEEDAEANGEKEGVNGVQETDANGEEGEKGAENEDEWEDEDEDGEEDGEEEDDEDEDEEEEDEEEIDDSFFNQEEGKREWVASCEGGCGHVFKDASEMWNCLTESGQVQLDDACYQKLKAGTLEKDVCGKDHQHYWIPKRDEKKLADIPKGSVLVGDSILTLEDWKEKVKAKYVDFY